MATATAKSNKIRVTYSDITLTLTPREAETLYVMTQYVAGNGETSRRGDIDSIKDALRNAVPDLIARIDYPIYQKFLVGKPTDTRGIEFKNDKEVKQWVDF